MQITIIRNEGVYNGRESGEFYIAQAHREACIGVSMRVMCA